MAAEWMRMAEEVDRLKGRNLRPVRDEITKLQFRKDTRDQLKGNAPVFSLQETD
jgi:hypothetical protein